MDLTTLIGIVCGIFLVINGIGLDKIGNFVDIPSILIVVGGTLAATIASYPLSILLDIPKHILILFRGKKYNIPALVEQMVDLAMVARQNGLLALEEKAEEIKDPFFKQSVLMIVDANDPDKVRFVLERELENMMVRHDAAAGLYEKASAYAPAFGMVGTLVGLINMLKGLNLDGSGGASNLGQDMSVALITTFYGSFLSNLFFHPDHVVPRAEFVSALIKFTNETIAHVCMELDAVVIEVRVFCWCAGNTCIHIENALFF